MLEHRRGARESEWLVLRRCLALLRRVQQGPANKDQLVAAVCAEIGADAYGGASGRALAERFHRDKQRLFSHLGVRLRYDASAGGYVIGELTQPLLSLPEGLLKTLAFLADTFQPGAPHADGVQQLVETLIAWSDDERRLIFNRARGLLPDIDLRERDEEPISADVWQRVLAARDMRQQIRFRYRSSRHEDSAARIHVVEPRRIYFSERGHYRLDGYCLYNEGPHGSWRPERYFAYRLSRIVPGSVEILPRRWLPVRTHRPYAVIYELSPEITRFGVSPRPELIAPPDISSAGDGWTRVEGQTHDVFHLARNLLYYGDRCRVLGGPELRREVEELVEGLAGVYIVPDPK